MSAELELKVIREGGLGEVVAVGREPFTIGRSGADLIVDDVAVSRRHCQLLRQGEAWIVRDLKSSNGTFVNGDKVVERPLREGDRVKVGKTEIVIHLREAATPGAGRGGAAGGGRAEAATPDDTAIWSLMELSAGASEVKNWYKAYLEMAMRRLQGERGCLVVQDPVTGVGVPVASVAMEYVETGLEGRVPFSRSIVEQAILERRVVMTSDADEDPRFKEAGSVAQYGIRAVLCAPARWHGMPVGALYVERLIGKALFNEENTLQAQDLADMFGVAEMAWRGHLMSKREAWERASLGRTFPHSTVNALVAKGGAAAVRREIRDVCAMTLYLSKLDGVLSGVHEEAWRLLSQLYGHFSEVVLQHGGAVLDGGYAQFGSVDEAESDFHIEAVRAGVEIQKLARPLVKRFARDYKLSLAVGVGLATGPALVGYFGAGPRIDFLGLGEVEPVSRGLAFQAEDGEVLIEANTYAKVRLHVNTHRLAPESLTGVEQQVQVYRVVPL